MLIDVSIVREEFDLGAGSNLARAMTFGRS